jgi:uncharacterized protein YndB with AHSA1/START domain
VRIEEQIEIRRPPAAVWAVVAYPAQDPRWCPKVRAVESVGSGRWRVTHRPVPLRPPVTLELAHVAAEAPARLVMREEDEAAVFDVEYRLEPVAGGGTRFTQISEIRWKRLPRFLHGTFRRGVRRDVRRQLRELARLVESA